MGPGGPRPAAGARPQQYGQGAMQAGPRMGQPRMQQQSGVVAGQPQPGQSRPQQVRQFLYLEKKVEFSIKSLKLLFRRRDIILNCVRFEERSNGHNNFQSSILIE